MVNYKSITNKHPNIVFIVLDTHRVDRLGCYGYPKNTSANIDDFASNSTIYKNAISPAQWTIPAHTSLFTGEYPSYHQTIQASHSLSETKTTFIEILAQNGYETYGFCNNPLVGVLNNGLRKGFMDFYNYGGAAPSPYERPEDIHNARTQFRRFIQKMIAPIANPIQQKVADSAVFFKFILNPRLVALWTRHANFKGDTARSLHDAQYLFSKHIQERNPKPQLFFINLMGTHLPYTPPRRFIKRYADFVLDSQESKQFINLYNTEAMKWLLPLQEPYPELEYKTLSSMYDAEVAYQDHLLGQLLGLLSTKPLSENTMVILVGDHGEMLGEHQIMGHGLGVYEELIHVPMIVHQPGQTEHRSVDIATSTKDLFEMVLNTAGFQLDSKTEPERAFTLSEAYAPDNVISIMERNQPELLRKFHSQNTNWAVYDGEFKLTRVEGIGDYLYEHRNGSTEDHPITNQPTIKTRLGHQLDNYLSEVKDLNHGDKSSNSDKLEVDKNLEERLRGLGYLE